MARDVRINKPDGSMYKEAELEEVLARVYSSDLFLAQVDEDAECLKLSSVQNFNTNGERVEIEEG